MLVPVLNCPEAPPSCILVLFFSCTHIFPYPFLSPPPPNSQQTTEEFFESYTQRLNSSEAVYNFELTAYFIYDAAWALAFAMNQ